MKYFAFFSCLLFSWCSVSAAYYDNGDYNGGGCEDCSRQEAELAACIRDTPPPPTEASILIGQFEEKWSQRSDKASNDLAMVADKLDSFVAAFEGDTKADANEDVSARLDSIEVVSGDWRKAVDAKVDVLSRGIGSANASLSRQLAAAASARKEAAESLARQLSGLKNQSEVLVSARAEAATSANRTTASLARQLAAIGNQSESLASAREEVAEFAAEAAASLARQLAALGNQSDSLATARQEVAEFAEAANAFLRSEMVSLQEEAANLTADLSRDIAAFRRWWGEESESLANDVIGINASVFAGLARMPSDFVREFNRSDVREGMIYALEETIYRMPDEFVRKLADSEFQATVIRAIGQRYRSIFDYGSELGRKEVTNERLEGDLNRCRAMNDRLIHQTAHNDPYFLDAVAEYLNGAYNQSITLPNSTFALLFVLVAVFNRSLFFLDTCATGPRPRGDRRRVNMIDWIIQNPGVFCAGLACVAFVILVEHTILLVMVFRDQRRAALLRAAAAAPTEDSADDA